MRKNLLGLRPWKRHSLVLAVLGVIYILIGISYITASPPPTRDDALQVALAIMPMTGWGLLFGAVGLLAIVSSRWPKASETWGYVALSSLSAAWSSFYVWGVVFGAPTAYLSGALVWAAIAFLWWAISGLVNPTDSVPDAPPHDLGGV